MVLAAYILILICIIGFFVSLVKIHKLRKKIYTSLACVLVIALIVLLGHSKENVDIQSRQALNQLTTKQVLSDDSDKNAVKEVVESPRPLKIQDLKVTNKNTAPDDSLNEYSEELVKINNKDYAVEAVCFMVPFPWVPFEQWQINQVHLK
jgi:multisubunit Na+/H+ antiporter MnhC subunit